MAISQGLTAIVKLLRTPEMNTAVTSFQADFRAASEQIAVMNDYKLLHDLLQQLENRYLLIYNDMGRLPADDLAWDSILLNEPDLRAKIDDLIAAAREASVAEREIDVRWVRHLEQARQDLQTAVDELELAPLKQAVRRLARLLNRQPSRVNAQLVTAVSGLRLGALEEALENINAKLSQHSGFFSAELRNQIKEAQRALADLDQRLTRQVQLHNALQEIDDEMRRVEASISRDISELEYAWFDLEPMARDLYKTGQGAWSSDLERACSRLDQSLTADQNTRKARRFFRSFHSQIRRLFRRVDMELLEMCEELQTVGESLDILHLDLFSRGGS
jgi:chromosome segregation ATPase